MMRCEFENWTETHWVKLQLWRGMQRKLLKEGTFYMGVVAGERNSGVCLAGRDEFRAKLKTQSAREIGRVWSRNREAGTYFFFFLSNTTDDDDCSIWIWFELSLRQLCFREGERSGGWRRSGGCSFGLWVTLVSCSRVLFELQYYHANTFNSIQGREGVLSWLVAGRGRKTAIAHCFSCSLLFVAPTQDFGRHSRKRRNNWKTQGDS